MGCVHKNSTNRFDWDGTDGNNFQDTRLQLRVHSHLWTSGKKRSARPVARQATESHHKNSLWKILILFSLNLNSAWWTLKRPAVIPFGTGSSMWRCFDSKAERSSESF